MATPFKLKSGNASAFKNLGSSPMKEFNMTGSIKAGEKIVSKVDVANALKVKTQNFRDAANKIKTVSSKTNKGSKVIQALKNTPKQYVKPAIKEIAKKGFEKIVSKVVAPLAVATTLYDFHQSGQKHSGGKVNVNQKSFMAEAKKKQKSIMKEGKKIKSILSKK